MLTYGTDPHRVTIRRQPAAPQVPEQDRPVLGECSCGEWSHNFGRHFMAMEDAKTAARNHLANPVKVAS